VNLKGDLQHLPAFIRYDSGPKKSVPHPDYGHEIRVTIAFNSALCPVQVKCWCSRVRQNAGCPRSGERGYTNI
jgi:hypothetical protein